MQIGVIRGPLTENEKSRRRSLGLCMYCGRPGHQVRECRAKPPSRSGEPAQPTTSVATHDLCTVTPSHIIVSLLLQWDQCAVPLRTMIDSGASGCFVDEKIAISLGIPIVSKSRSYAIQLLDGSSPISGPIIKETRPLLVSLGTEHRDTIVFDIVTSPVFPAVLGLNWLRRNNPSINWSSGAVSFNAETNISTTDLHACTTPAIAMCLEVPEPYQAFSHVFEKKGADTLPPHRPYDCPVDLLPGAPIPYGRIYPLSEPELLVLKDYIDDNLEKGFIRPSTSPAGAPIFFVGKKDGGLRPCVDYRAMNAITIKNKYPLPLISELMDRLRSANIFTKLDLRGAYNLIRVKSGDEWKTAFRSRYGHYEYMGMPYGLCNAPATFQRFLNDVFRDILDSYIIIYLDDILIYSEDLKAHREHVKTVLRRLQEQRLYAKAEKCIFDTDTVEFLGFIISPGNIRMDPTKTEAVATWPVPANKKGVQSFIGFCNFYRKFIRGFSTIIRPLTRLTRQDIKFIWTEDAQKAFHKLKNMFTQAPILTLPDPTYPYVLEVDASEFAVGAVLSQRLVKTGRIHPVYFFSKGLSPAERNYDVGERELLAIKMALEEWRHLLEGARHPVTVFTDHRNLEYLQRARRLKPRQARWALFISRFDLHITYRPGRKNGKADALSRIGNPERTREQETILPSTCFLTQENTLWQMIARNTPSLQEAPTGIPFSEKDGFLIHRERIYVPPLAVTAVLQHFHDSTLGGHRGIHKTSDIIKRSFWWPHMSRTITEYITNCPICIRMKTSRHRPQGLLHPLPVPSVPWSDIAMDFIVELPKSSKHDTVMVVVDRFTKMAHFIPLVGLPTATETASVFIKEIFRLHGLPSTIVTDRGTQFTARFWRAFCKGLHITQALTSAYHPQANGQTERTNGILEQYLRCYISHLQHDWF
uniref:Gypsy retrotransposon integrase-like protein 1 n=1 Tax=Leptobrachium leishanense TaxID=445787 RepID=A0A8C5QSG8_9ANUR